MAWLDLHTASYGESLSEGHVGQQALQSLAGSMMAHGESFCRYRNVLRHRFRVRVV